MSANKIANTHARAVRTISILLLTILALSGLSFVIGATSFKLGLDLQGGMSVTMDVSLEGMIKSLSNNPKDAQLLSALRTATAQKASSEADYITLFSDANVS